jgi:RNA polymerase sigma-B factor
VVTTLLPEHDAVPLHPLAPVEGKERARRTDGIVADLRVVEPESQDSRTLTDQLIETNVGVARSMAGRYRNRGIDLDDLEQVALLGLTKAAQRFDPSAGHDFLSYAVPTIRGELRRHFRDAGWMVRPPRRVQDLQARIARAQDELEPKLGRSPRPSEVASHLGVELDDVVEALAADGCFTPTSLDGPVGDGASSLGDLLGDEDRAIESAEARVVLGPVLRTLSRRDQRILQLRFVEERTQQEIAEAIGLTQAQVSRVLTRILDELRSGLREPLPAA